MKMISGYMYLHMNGDLVWQPDCDPVALRKNDFVRALWLIDPESRLSVWDCLLGASALSASPERVADLRSKWQVDDTANYLKACALIAEMDGAQWCVHASQWINPQEQPVGFGATQFDAIVALLKEIQFTQTKIWVDPASWWLRNKTLPPRGIDERPERP